MAAELVSTLVSPIMEKIGEFIFAKVKRQFIYLCCFNSNIQSLTEEVQNLTNERDGLQRRVDTAKRNTDDILPIVDAWLKRSDEIQVHTNGIEEEITNVKSGCSAIKSRFLLSRKARKTADAINLHREKGKFEEISVPAPPAAMESIPQGPSQEFDSRKQIEKEIMEDLRGGNVHIMGICGMGGVGKTTMATRIMNRVREENLFEEVAKIVVSQKVNEPEIQREIAENFGVTFEEKSLSARANKLHKRLTDAKRKLLILDDIWEELDLKCLGIPCKSDEGEGCTILLTSRSREVVSDMNAKPFGVQILTQEEALLLFRGKVGTCAEPEEVVKEVVTECKGLPLALVTVGAALKDKSAQHWNDALRKLKSSNPNIPKVLKKVYEPIKVSYDFLDNPDARSLFLVCCLFPEDCDIDLELFTIYGMGLRMFTADEITTLEEARDSVRVLVDMLKSCFLLLDGSDKNHVKMHDVVRDVAIFIASEEGRIVRKLTASGREESINCKWISVVGEEINKLPIWSSFPSLRLLKMDNYPGEVEINTDSSFFEGMIMLNVVSLSHIPFRSLPETTELLKYLQTLHLEDCGSLETISIVGKLLSLEILICRRCDSIAELPDEIGRLKKLRMLEVNECRKLKRIAPGVLSNFAQLEELIIVESFDGWETKANGEQRKNVALCEIEHLEKLTRLEIDIYDVTLATEEIRFPSKIVKFAVTVGGREYSFDDVPYERKMNVTSRRDITFGKWVQVFLTSTEYLRASGEGANNLDISQAQKMKSLILEDCSNVNKLVNITPSMDRIGVFPLLESLKLYHLPNLEDICVGSIPKPSISFGNLKELHLEGLPALEQLWKSPHQYVSPCNLTSICVRGCSKLKKLFSLSIAKDCLLQLETLDIGWCEMMEHVFDEMDREECHKITFQNLKSLQLSSLSSLISFYKGSANIEFPLLQTIFFRECGKLKSFSSTGDSRNLAEHEDSFHVFFNQKVGFCSLMKIVICGCNNIQSLFVSSVAKNLVNLTELIIEGCTEIVKVIETDDDKLYENSLPLFPCLKKLYFENLPKLQSFGKGRFDELSLLESIEIDNCPLLEVFNAESVGFHRLKKIKIYRCNNDGSLFLFPIAKTLVNLKHLKIENCTKMVKVIEDDDDMSCKKPLLLFPSLTKLTFCELPKVESFCDWRSDFQLPLLEELKFEECHFLGSFIMKCVTFDRLTKITIIKCNDIVSLFSSSIAKSLVNLKKLEIVECKEMIKVIEDDEKMLREKFLLLFPCLNELRLKYLPKLESFCNWKCDLQLSSLEEVVIENCPLLAFFSMGNVTTPNLDYISINWEDRNLGDLNTVIKGHFNAERQEDIDGGGHTFIEESTSTEMKGVEAHNEEIETQVEEIIEENAEK